MFYISLTYTVRHTPPNILCLSEVMEKFGKVVILIIYLFW